MKTNQEKLEAMTDMSQEQMTASQADMKAMIDANQESLWKIWQGILANWEWIKAGQKRMRAIIKTIKKR
jgi:hypothetical protein